LLYTAAAAAAAAILMIMLLFMILFMILLIYYCYTERNVNIQQYAISWYYIKPSIFSFL
jgi:cbb3-type cytochrome oxidase subunit 3